MGPFPGMGLHNLYRFPFPVCFLKRKFPVRLSLSSPRPTNARRPVTGNDRCAAGPAAPCGSVPILLPPSPRRPPTATYHRNISCHPAIRCSSSPPKSSSLAVRQARSGSVRGDDRDRERERATRGSQLGRRRRRRKCWRCSIRRWRRAPRGCGSRAPRGKSARRSWRTGSWKRVPTRSPSTSAVPAPWRTPQTARALSSPGNKLGNALLLISFAHHLSCDIPP